MSSSVMMCECAVSWGFARLVVDAVDALVMVWDWFAGRFEWSPIRLIVAFFLGIA